MEITPALKKLGLGDKEIRVYLSCLLLGPSPVRKIAVHAEVNRGTTYDLLKSLIQRGLITYYHREKHQYFVAENPEKLVGVVAAREQELAKSKEEIVAALPELQSLFNSVGGKPVVRYYEGYGGVKHILEDVLRTMDDDSKKTYYVYSSATIRDALYKMYPRFTDERVKQKIAVRVIAIGEGGDEQLLAERKWLTKTPNVPTYSILYGNKTAFISLDSANIPLGVIIEDESIAKTQKMFFEQLWRTLP